nr:hypothetical protein [Micromonospora sp. MW-13]
MRFPLGQQGQHGDGQDESGRHQPRRDVGAEPGHQVQDHHRAYGEAGHATGGEQADGQPGVGRGGASHDAGRDRMQGGGADAPDNEQQQRHRDVTCHGDEAERDGGHGDAGGGDPPHPDPVGDRPECRLGERGADVERRDQQRQRRGARAETHLQGGQQRSEDGGQRVVGGVRHREQDRHGGSGDQPWSANNVWHAMSFIDRAPWGLPDGVKLSVGRRPALSAHPPRPAHPVHEPD